MPHATRYRSRYVRKYPVDALWQGMEWLTTCDNVWDALLFMSPKSDLFCVCHCCAVRITMLNWCVPHWHEDELVLINFNWTSWSITEFQTMWYCIIWFKNYVIAHKLQGKYLSCLLWSKLRFKSLKSSLIHVNWIKQWEARQTSVHNGHRSRTAQPTLRRSHFLNGVPLKNSRKWAECFRRSMWLRFDPKQHGPCLYYGRNGWKILACMHSVSGRGLWHSDLSLVNRTI